MIQIGKEKPSNLQKMIIFSTCSCLGPVPQVFGQVKEWLILKLHEMIRVSHVIACPIFIIIAIIINIIIIVIIIIIIFGWPRFGWRSASDQSYKNWSFFGVLSLLGNFQHVFGQLNDWLTLKVQGMIRESHVVSCPMNFNLLCDAYKQGWVLKLLKKIFYIFSRFGHFPQVFGQI